MTASHPLEQLGAVIAELERTPLDAESVRALGDDELLTLTELGATARRLVDARTALIAGEIAHRSRPELAHSGLAQRLGHRTAEELVRISTGSSRRDASTAVRAGLLLVTTPAATPTESGSPADTGSPANAGSPADTGAPANAGSPADTGAPTDSAAPVHLEPAVRSAREGAISTGALDSIRAAFDELPSTVPPEHALRAVERLVEAALVLDVDRLHRLARQARDELDANAIADREKAQREARSFRLIPLPDGMARATWMLDPESAAHVRDLLDRAISPQRRNVHFVDPAEAEKAARIALDERTPEQYASDALLHLLIAGADADSSMMLGTGAPSVRVLVTARDLVRGQGSASLEASIGQPEGAVVALPTAQRLLCSGTHTPVLLSTTGQPLDVGRTQRLFTTRQRMALAARDGGCRWPGCERPPSWCEAHHIDEWLRDHGRTDVEVGILLCRHHHLLLHEQDWRVVRADGARGASNAEYSLIPPESVDQERQPRPMPSRSREWKRALAS